MESITTSLDTITIEEEPPLVIRLRKVKEAVKKATQEAGKHLAATDSPFVENNDPNASFHLGMELFGQDVRNIEMNVQEKLLQMEQELESIASGVQTGALHESCEHRSLHSSPEELEEESEQLKAKIRFLKECSSARSFLDESITLSTPALAPNEEPDQLNAVQLLLKSKQALQQAKEILQEEEERNSKSPALAPGHTLLDSVESSQRRQKADLIRKAVSLWNSCVSLTSHTLSVRAPESLNVAYGMLETFKDDGTLEILLRNFTRTLQTDVFQTLLEEHLTGKPKAARTFHESEDRGMTSLLGNSALTKGSVRRLEWTCEDDVISNIESLSPKVHIVQHWGDTLMFIKRITSFVADHVLLQRSSLCSFVALRLFGKPSAMPSALNLHALGLESRRLGDDNGLLLQPLLDAMEMTCIPRHLKPSELGQLQTMADELGSFLDPFVQEIASKNLLPKDSQMRLSTFTASFQQMYVDNRRCVLLNEARNMLVSNDYHNTVVVGEDVHRNKEAEALGLSDGMAVFKLHKASISDTAFRLMERCRQSMDEAVEQHSTTVDSPLSLLPATLYRTAREMLDLFRAIIPVKHGHEVANVPRTAAVLHNDCVFFAHHCLTLGLEYKDKFPEASPDDARGKLVRQTCIFIDMVPLFRNLADRALGDMLDAQACQLVELVKDRIPLMGEALRSEEILSEWSDAETALSASLYHVRHLSQAWKPILSYDMLNRSLGHLVDAVLTLFLDQVDKASDISSNACSFIHSLFQKATHDLEIILEGDTSESRVWDRFLAVGRLMDMSIGDIQVALSNGLFRSVTGPELSRLVTSCFDDSPKRRSLLKTLAANQ